MLVKTQGFFRFVWNTKEHRYMAASAICVVVTWTVSNLVAYRTEGELREHELLQREIHHLEDLRTQWQVYEDFLLLQSDSISNRSLLTTRFYQLMCMFNAIQCRIDVVPQDSLFLSMPYSQFHEDVAKIMSINYGASFETVTQELSRYSQYEKEYFRLSADSDHVVKWTKSRHFRSQLQKLFAAFYALSGLLFIFGFYYRHEASIVSAGHLEKNT